jgi:hypothetical protein
MPDCPSCGAPLKAGDWMCGRCGTTVAAAGAAGAGGYGAPASDGPYGSSQGYLPEYQPQGAAAAAAESGSSGLLRAIILIAVVAVIAIVAVWFFVLRGPKTTGEEFVGSWTATTQKGIATAAVAKLDDKFTVRLGGSQQGQQVTVPAHLDGADLVITLDDFSQLAGEANADRFKAALQALAGDFRMVFSSVDPTHLSLRILGTAPSGQDLDQTIPLIKEIAAPT